MLYTQVLNPINPFRNQDPQHRTGSGNTSRSRVSKSSNCFLTKYGVGCKVCDRPRKLWGFTGSGFSELLLLESDETVWHVANFTARAHLEKKGACSKP